MLVLKLILNIIKKIEIFTELPHTQGIFKLQKISQENSKNFISFLNSGKFRFFLKISGKFYDFKNLRKSIFLDIE